MKRRAGITFRLVALMWTGTALILLAITAYTYLSMGSYLKASIQGIALRTSENLGLHIELITENIESTAKALAAKAGASTSQALREGSEESGQIYEILADYLMANSSTLGIAILFDPASFGEEFAHLLYAPLVTRSGDGYVSMDLKIYNPDYLNSDLFIDAKRRGTFNWSEPFYAEAGKTQVVTCEYPFPKGVVICDVALHWLREVAENLQLPFGGRLRLRSAAGQAIVETGGVKLPEHVPSATSMDSDLSADIWHFTDEDRETYFVMSRILPDTGWLCDIYFPKDELDDAAIRASGIIFAIGAFGLIPLALVIWLIAHRISRPLIGLRNTALRMTHGGLDNEIPVIRDGGSEIESLSIAFESMRSDLVKQMSEIERMTAEREGERKELEIAWQIQRSFLPNTFPHDEKYEIAARLVPAKTVGGDFYDVFPTDRDTVYVVIGDVSGKGVSAAIFMSSTLSYLRAILRNGPGPAKALSLLSETLCRENETCMFVTLLLIEFYPATGTCTIANGGHLPPILIRNGTAAPAELPPGIALGISPHAYQSSLFSLSNGDRLLLYTDGLTEATDAGGCLFGITRALDAVEAAGNCPDAEGTLENLLDTLREYEADIPQSDDQTLLLLHYRNG